MQSQVCCKEGRGSREEQKDELHADHHGGGVRLHLVPYQPDQPAQ